MKKFNVFRWLLVAAIAIPVLFVAETAMGHGSGGSGTGGASGGHGTGSGTGSGQGTGGGTNGAPAAAGGHGAAAAQGKGGHHALLASDLPKRPATCASLMKSIFFTLNADSPPDSLILASPIGGTRTNMRTTITGFGKIWP